MVVTGKNFILIQLFEKKITFLINTWKYIIHSIDPEVFLQEVITNESVSSLISFVLESHGKIDLFYYR